MAKWLLICSKCAWRIEQGELIEGKCPECGAASWLCHLIGQDDQRDDDPEPGDFYCKACLMDKVEADMSPDDRYCQDCYEFLLKEAEMLTGHQRADWRPRAAVARRESEAKLTPPISQIGGGIMSTLDSLKNTVDIIQPSVTIRAIVKRGPKHRQLPEDLIRELASEGMGSKAIALRLRTEGVTVSYKTIQRLLSGQRVLI